MKSRLTFRILFLLLCLGTLNSETRAQNKLILHHGLKRHVIRRGQLVGVTIKGQPYTYTEWYNRCFCADSIQKQFWIIDSIGRNSLSLIHCSSKITYTYDTISVASRYYCRKFHAEYIGPVSSQPGKNTERYVYKTPVFHPYVSARRSIPFDSLESFTLFKGSLKHCSVSPEPLHVDWTFITDADPAGKTKGILTAALFMLSAEIVLDATFNPTVLITAAIQDERQSLRRYRMEEWKLN
ncbi:MAG TPA: hypothetical protein VGO45_08585 [Bacteroidia bacterium]|jgi:hypothetical protein|nr:hypothetical protein [Bacteroidia bacterium]